MLLVQDNSIAVWDLALERDPEEEIRLAADCINIKNVAPAQLLFLHAGQTDVKEVHWHSQIPGMLVSTAGDSFNIFKPSNMFELPARGKRQRDADQDSDKEQPITQSCTWL